MLETNRNNRVVIILSLLFLFIAISAVLGGGGGLYVDWWSADSSAVQGMNGGNFSLSGAAGQSEAGRVAGGIYVLNEGFFPVVSTSHTSPTDVKDWSLYR